MAKRLAHRGPDAQRALDLPDGRGVFAHARLAVIDLSPRALQPFSSEDGQLVLVYNGEVYGYRALRRILESEGARFRTTSDTEVILELYRHRGVEGLSALDGMFAFALYDAPRRRLVLMRDRLGKKPLFHARTRTGTWLFASEPKALFLHPELPAELDPGSLPELLTFGYVGTPRAFYKGVHKLPPAHTLVVEGDGAPRLTPYWDMERAFSRRRPGISLEEAKHAVRKTVGDAVERRLVADVPVGAFLSGGIDSSVVVAEMARRSSSRPRTFSVGFSEDSSFDETPYARKVARLFDTEHTELVLPRIPTDRLDLLLDHHDEPFGDSSAVALLAVAEVTRAHVPVVLTGDGGDEAFAGYTRFVGALVDDRLPTALKRAAHRLTSELPDPAGYKNPLALAKRFVQHAARSPDEQLIAWNTFFTGDALGRLLRTADPWAPVRAQAEILAKARRRGEDRLHQILLHNLETYLLDDLLVKADRATMAVGLEARSPFLDVDVLELALSLPSSMLIHRGSMKWILREAYRDVLPPEILDRKKHGFGVPVGAWWKSTHTRLLDELLVTAESRAKRLLDGAEIDRVVSEHREGRRDHGQRIFLLVMLELCLRRLEKPRAP